jgi:hypothetical protein
MDNEIEQLAREYKGINNKGNSENTLAPLDNIKWIMEFMVSKGYRKTQPESSGLEQEKQTRIKYQEIVYKICSFFDEYVFIDNRHSVSRCTIDTVVDKVKELKKGQPKNDLEPLYIECVGICEECDAVFNCQEMNPDGKWGHTCKAKKYKEEHRCESYLNKYSKFGHKKTDIKVPSVAEMIDIVDKFYIKGAEENGSTSLSNILPRHSLRNAMECIHSLLSVAVGKDGK